MKKTQFVDKVYKLKKEAAPLSYMLPTRNTQRFPLLWFDEEKGVNRPLRYAKNQRSPFEDEQDGNAIVEPIIFEDGFLTVPRSNQVLQKFLHYHPYNGKSFIEVNKEKYAEVVSVTDFTFSGERGRKYIECNGFGGDTTKFLQQGDLVQFTDTNDTIIRCIVQYATKPEGVLKSRIYFDRSLPADVSNASVVRVRPSISNFNQGTLLYKTGTSQVSSIVADSEDSKISYFLRRDFVSTGAGGQGVITFAAQLPFGTQRFVSFDESNFLVTVLDPGDAPDITGGDIIYITSSQVTIKASTDSASGLTSGSVKLNLPADYFGSIPTGGIYPTLKLTATLEVKKAKPRLKTSVVNRRIVVDSAGDRVIPLRGRDYDSEDLSVYSYADVYKLHYVYEGSPSEPPTVGCWRHLLLQTVWLFGLFQA